MSQDNAHNRSKLPFSTIGVIGGGQMGRGIARSSLKVGYKVVMVDHSEKALEHAKHRIKHYPELTLNDGQFTASLQLDVLKNADLVIETINESEDEKRQLYQTLKGVLKAEAILASNSSSLSVTRLAAASDRPASFCGMHFMNPVSLMNLVELVRGLATDESVYEKCRSYVESLGKTVAEAEDFPGFIVNRVLVPMINEAIYALYEGVGSVTTIDQSLRLGANHPQGPLELADFIGLDTVLAILTSLHQDLADNKYRPCPLLVKYVEADWLGRKVGRGFYDYASNPPRPTR